MKAVSEGPYIVLPLPLDQLNSSEPQFQGGRCGAVTLAWGKEVDQFAIIFTYTVSSRPAWATVDSFYIQKLEKKKKNGRASQT